MKLLCLSIVLAPLIGSLIAGLFGRNIGRSGAHSVTILGVLISFILSLFVFKHVIFENNPKTIIDIYHWLSLGGLDFKVGFLIDPLTITMMLVVTSVV